MRELPRWRRAFDTGERTVAKVLDAGIHTSEFADLMVLAVRTKRQAHTALEGVRTQLLHVAGMAAVRDVNRLARSLRRIEGQLRELTAMVELQANTRKARDDGHWTLERT